MWPDFTDPPDDDGFSPMLPDHGPAETPDGLIEAFRVADAAGFAIAVQWHPEWRFEGNALSTALFKAFGDACRRRANKRRCV